MQYLPFKHFMAGMVFASIACVTVLAQKSPWSDVGTTMTPEEVRTQAKGTGPSGKDLPPGRGTAKEGAQIFMVKCSMCHGQDLKGVNPPPGSGIILRGPSLVGGKGVPLWANGAPSPGVSKAYYTAYATTLWNAVAISMPFFKPGSLTPNEVYSLVAYILYKNEFFKEDAVLDRETLPKVQLPQRENHIPAKLEDISDIEKRGCYKTYGVCP